MLSRLLFLGFAMLLSWSLQAQFPCVAGEISLYPGQTASFCDAGNGEPVFIRFRARPTGVPRAYVVVNGEDEIVYIGYGSTINFVGLGSNLRVYSFTLVGSITAEIGDNINDTQLASGCSELSSNFIDIGMDNGGQVGGTLSGGPFEFCVGDAEPDFIPEGAITLTDEVAENLSWIVTDSNGNILGLPPSPYVVDFDGAGSGTCNIYNVSYLEGLQGLEMNANISDLMGCFDLSNAIEVIRNEVEGGTLEGGPFSFCVGDGVADMIGENEITLSGNSGSNSQWVITDADGNILGLPPTFSVVDFDDAGTGTCLVYHLSYADGIEGLVADANVNDLMGCFDLSNSIAVNRTTSDGGTLTGGPFTFCVGDGIPDLIGEDEITLSDNTGTNSQWVVTDADGNILGLPPTFSVVDFDGAGAGACLVYHLSYEEELEGLVVDANIADLMGCFGLSNPITVNRNQPEGGTLEGGPFSFCVNDGEADLIGEDEITLSGNDGSNSQWVVTDADGNILGLPPTFSVVDFDGAGSGTCFVYHLSYVDGIEGLAEAANIADLVGCFDLSNGIVVNRGETTASSLVGGPFDFCVGNFDPDFIPEGAITLNEGIGDNSSWVITDSDGTILGLPPSPYVVDFDFSGGGTCLIYHLNYVTGLVGLSEDANIADLDGCFTLSNAVTVNRTDPDAGVILGGPYTFCVGDGSPDMLDESAINIVGGAVDNVFWIVTDTEDNIIGTPPSFTDVDFDGAGAGTCYIRRVTGVFEDGAGLEVGTNLDDLVGCFALSNRVTINRIQPEGGVLEGGPFTFCVGDGVADMIGEDEITLSGNTGANSQWVVTDADGNILGLPPSFTAVDFDGAGTGTCLVYHLSYEDGLEGLEGELNIADLVGCFNLSNGIPVNRNTPIGGTLEGGPFSFCVSDGIADLIGEDEITLSGNSGSNSQWVITDADGTILGLPPTFAAVDFDGAGEGNCLVYHLSYEDGLEGLEGELNIADLAGCFELSNSITVERTAINGGAVTTIDGETSVDVTVNDGIDDIIQFMSTNAIGENFTYVITDANNQVLAIPEGDSANFEGAGVGVCRVWGLAYTGALLLQEGDIVGQAAPSEGCFAISDIFITVNRTEGIQPNVPTNRSSFSTMLDVQLYPNPAIDQLQVKLSQNQASSLENAVELMVIQLDGKVVYRNTIGAGQLLSTVDVSQLPAGAYFIRINDGEQIVTKRFLKAN